MLESCFTQHNLQSLRTAFSGTRSQILIIPCQNVNANDLVVFYAAAFNEFVVRLHTMDVALQSMQMDILTLEACDNLHPICLSILDTYCKQEGVVIQQHSIEWNSRLQSSLRSISELAVAAGQTVSLPFAPLTSLIDDLMLVFDQLCGRYALVLRSYDNVLLHHPLDPSVQLLFVAPRRVSIFPFFSYPSGVLLPILVACLSPISSTSSTSSYPNHDPTF